MRKLFILRPEPGAGRTAERARALGLEPRLQPLFAVRPVGWTAPDPAGFDGIVLTSANALRHGGDELGKLAALPVHAVGEATAALARQAGFAIASVGGGGAQAMELPAGKRLLHLAGCDHRPVPAAVTVIVYQAWPIEPPPDLGGLGGAVAAVHSARAGRRLAELVADRSTIAIAAISAAAAAACGEGWQRVEAAAEPTDAALLALARELCESPPP